MALMNGGRDCEPVFSLDFTVNVYYILMDNPTARRVANCEVSFLLGYTFRSNNVTKTRFATLWLIHTFKMILTQVP